MMNLHEMNYVVLDVETTTIQDGNPDVPGNVLCSVGLKNQQIHKVFRIEHGNHPYGPELIKIQNIIEATDIVVAFNAKFDVAWINKYCPTIKWPKIWDLQIGHYMLLNQKAKFPSLNKVLQYYKLPPKLEKVKEYWDNGIDTTQIPWEDLEEYNQSDIKLEEAVFLHQVVDIYTRPSNFIKLFKLHCHDSFNFLDMQENGILLHHDNLRAYSHELTARLATCRARLLATINLPALSDTINLGSGDHLSFILYGGKLPKNVRCTYNRQLKNGNIVVREKWGIEYHDIPGLIKPNPRHETLPTRNWDDNHLDQLNSERIANGKPIYQRVYATNEKVLRNVYRKASKRAQAIIDQILEISKLEKAQETYYDGLLKKMQIMNWQPGYLHGHYNQAATETGRPSSSGPNMQNLAGELKQYIISRYD